MLRPVELNSILLAECILSVQIVYVHGGSRQETPRSTVSVSFQLGHPCSQYQERHSKSYTVSFAVLALPYLMNIPKHARGGWIWSSTPERGTVDSPAAIPSLKLFYRIVFVIIYLNKYEILFSTMISPPASGLKLQRVPKCMTLFKEQSGSLVQIHECTMLAIRSGLIAAGVFVKYQLKSCASGDMTTGIYKNADTVTVHSATRLCILKMQSPRALAHHRLCPKSR